MNATADRSVINSGCYCRDLQGVRCGFCAAQMLNEWATSRAGTCRIRLYQSGHDTIGVYALDGHELLPVSKSFPKTPDGERDARAYANRLWATR